MSDATPASLFQLSTLGSLQFRAPDDASPEVRELAEQFETRRRVLALLVVLALSPRPLSRDVLADYFWPNSDPARARHSLVEATRVIRSVLGPESIASRARVLSLAPDVPLVVDALRFREAAEAGRHAEAIALYTGDFFEGEFVDRAPRFEQWVDAERDTFRTLFVEACAAYFRSDAAGDTREQQVRIAERWLAAAPLSGEAALAWCEAMAADRSPEVVRQTRLAYESWCAMLAAEFDELPDTQVVTFMQRLAPRVATPPRGVPGTPEPAADVSAPIERAHDAAAVVAAPAPALVDEPDGDAVGRAAPYLRVNPNRAARRRRLWTATAGLVALAGLAVAANALGWGPDALQVMNRDLRGTPEAPSLVVVADAVNGTADSTLGQAVTLAIRTALVDSRTVRVVPESRVRRIRSFMSAATTPDLSVPFTDSAALLVAARAGADAVVVPVVVAVGPKYRVAARLVRVRDGADVVSLQSAPTEGSELLTALDDVVARTRERLGAGRDELAVSTPLPDVTTASLAALRAYAEGIRHYQRSDYLSAVASYERAVRIDSTFAMAWVTLGSTIAYLNQPAAADTAFARAMPFLSRLTPREQMLSRAKIARAHKQLDSAVALRQRWLDANPDDLEALSGQGYDLLLLARHQEAIAIYRRLVQVDSTDDSAWSNLASVMKGVPGLEREAVQMFSRAIRLRPSLLHDGIIGPQYGAALVNAGQLDSAERVFRSQMDTSISMRGRFYRSLGQLELWRGRPGGAVPQFQHAIDYSRKAGEHLSAVRSMLWLELARRDAGDSAGARRIRDSLPVLTQDPNISEPLVLYWVGQRLARAGDMRGAQRVLEHLRMRERAVNPSHRAARLLLTAELSMARSRADVRPMIREALALDSSDVAYESWGYAAWHAGDRAEATRVYSALRMRRLTFGWEAATLVQYAPLVLARISEGVPPIGLPGAQSLRVMAAPPTTTAPRGIARATTQ